MHSAPLAFGHHMTISLSTIDEWQLMIINEQIWSTLLLRKGMKIAETTLSMPQSRFSVSDAATFTKWKEFHILTDSNLSSFCTYFHSRQTTQFSSLLLYFDRVIPLIRPPMISRWNVSSPRVLFVCVLDWRSISLNHNMKWSASCRSNIEYF